MKRISKEIQVALVSLIESGKVGAAVELATQLNLETGALDAIRNVERSTAEKVLSAMYEAECVLSMYVDRNEKPTNLSKEEAAKAAKLKDSTYDDAVSKITLQTIASMGYGDEVQLNKKYFLYHYSEDEYIALRHVDFDCEDIYTVQFGITEDDGKGNCKYEIEITVENEEVNDFLTKSEAAV